MDEKFIVSLISRALEAREYSYCPYSGYAVGAALCSMDEKIFLGCNIENSSYGATNCAERTALFKAVSEGVTTFKAIAVCGGKKGEKPVSYAFPCGICRQALCEFCEADFQIIVANSTEDYKVYRLDELLPEMFSASSME